MAEPSLTSTVRTAAGRTALCALLLAPAACSGSDDAEPDPERLASCTPSAPDESGADDPVQIVLAHVESELRADTLTELIGEFNAANPDVRVLIEQGAGGAPTLLERWQDQRTEERPALTMLPKQQLGRLADSDQTIAPGPCLREVVPDLLPSIEEAWSLGGVLQAVPFAVSTPLTFYNRRLFEDAGLDPDDPPATFDETLAVAPTLIEQGTAGGALVFETAAESGGSWYVEQTLAKAGLPSLLPDNGRGPQPAARVNWRAQPAVEALTWLRTMYERELAVSVGRNAEGRADLIRAGTEGDLVAMTVHTSASLGQVLNVLDGEESANAEVDLAGIDLGVAPLIGPGDGSLAGGDALWLAAGKSERETAAAWRLAAWLASPEVDGRWAAATGYVPISESAVEQPALVDEWRTHPPARVAYDVLSHQGTSVTALGPVAGPLPELHEMLAEAVEAAVLEGTDPSEALDSAADEAEALLAAYNETHARASD